MTRAAAIVALIEWLNAHDRFGCRRVSASLAVVSNRSRADHAKSIEIAWAQVANAVIDVGIKLIEAKAELPQELGTGSALLLQLKSKLEVRIGQKSAEATDTVGKFRCPSCDEILEECDLAVVRECSREDCGTKFNGNLEAA